MLNGEPCACPGAGEVMRELREEDLLELEPGERLWKLYCFRASDPTTDLRHRIYPKQKANGRLAMVTFAAHTPSNTEGGPRVVRSALARVPDLSPADLDRLIEVMRTQAGEETCEEVDLSHLSSLAAQWEWLSGQ
jgi:hypothetical protein